MADNLIGVYVLYQAPHFTGLAPDAFKQVAVNTDRINAFTPRFAYLLRYLVPGNPQTINYQLTFQPTSAELIDPNTLQGVYVEQDGKGILVDCVSVADFITNANAGTNPTRLYGSGVPAFVTPTATVYCITRNDDGSATAVSQVAMDYIGQIYGNISHKSNVSGTSKYQVNAFGRPKPIGADVVALGAC